MLEFVLSILFIFKYKKILLFIINCKINFKMFINMQNQHLMSLLIHKIIVLLNWLIFMKIIKSINIKINIIHFKILLHLFYIKRLNLCLIFLEDFSNLDHLIKLNCIILNFWKIFTMILTKASIILHKKR